MVLTFVHVFSLLYVTMAIALLIAVWCRAKISVNERKARHLPAPENIASGKKPKGSGPEISGAGHISLGQTLS